MLRELHRLAKMAMGDIPIRKVVTQGRGKNAKPVEILLHHVDIQGAARAWELIGKADPIRLFVEQHEHSGRGGGPIMTEDAPMGDVERARRVAYILMRGAEAQTEKAENADHDNPHIRTSPGACFERRGPPARGGVAGRVAAFPPRSVTRGGMRSRRTSGFRRPGLRTAGRQRDVGCHGRCPLARHARWGRCRCSCGRDGVRRAATSKALARAMQDILNEPGATAATAMQIFIEPLQPADQAYLLIG